MHSIPLLACVVLSGVLPIIPMHAGADAKDAGSKEVQEVDWFHTGALELQAMTGVFFSQQPTHDARPNIDYSLTVLRLGYMIDTPRGHGFLRGNDEVLVEASGAAIFQGPGSGIGGLNLLYRRNFVQPHAWVIPYFTAGLGGVYNDIYHNKVERAAGQAFEFNLQAEIGLRILLGGGPWAFDAAAAYRHISDAGISSRNDGIDSVGGLIGFSRFF